MKNPLKSVIKDPQGSAPELRSRRRFIKSSAYLGAASATGILGSSALAGTASARETAPVSGGENTRSMEAFKYRTDAARLHLTETLALPEQESNGDERRYARENFYASFTKCLPHDAFGEVDRSAYVALLRAQRSGDNQDFANVPLDPTAARTLANPQGAYRLICAGLDGHATRMRPAPTFRSAETAGEMGELYWQALTRDVPFSQYDTDLGIADAVADLNNFSEPVGPKQNGLIAPETLFRGPTPGDLTGPYVSQFLWQDVPYGPSLIEQRYEKPVAALEFMVDESNWLNVQRGGAPLEDMVFDARFRYLHDNRSLGEYVHRDVLFQAFFNAGLILLGYGNAAVDQGNPYYNGSLGNQGAFTSLGAPYMIDLVTQCGNMGLQGAWYQKWLQHRRLRPETFGGRVHFMQSGQREYEIHPDILNSRAVEEAFLRSGSYLLPMGYTEGSPTHPSYPAGHATVSGACATALKAFFNEDFVIPSPVMANDDGSALNAWGGSDLTVGGEINKLASNIAIARNAAGVHYRSDGVDGLLVGEQQAVALLKDYSLGLSEDFGGFSLTRFDGTPILIRNGEVIDV